MNSKCFICSVQRAEFDRKGRGFDHHIKRDHNMWNYLYFMVKLNENTNVSLPIRNLIALVAAVAIGVWAYFGVIERLNLLETADTLFKADLLKRAEQEPKNLEMYMLIEHLAGQIESIEKEIEASRYNKVNIDHLKEQVDMLQKKLNGNHQ